MKRDRVTAILFDLDGTLIDSLPGLETSLRLAAERCLPGRRFPDIRRAIGPPIKVLLSRLWPELADDQLQEMSAVFRSHYDTEGCRESRLFEGVAQTLATLQERGIDMFVLTNKPLQPTLTILRLTGVEGRFRAIISPDSSDPPFPVKSAGAVHLQQRFELPSASTFMVGDGMDDVEAAAACGFGFILAGYGYGNAIGRQDLAAASTLETFSEIERIVR